MMNKEEFTQRILKETAKKKREKEKLINNYIYHSAGKKRRSAMKSKA